MALKGLSLPLRATPAGRSAIASGDDHAEIVLRVALQDCDSENAFQQDDGIGQEAVFGVAGEPLRGRVLRRLTSIFREFERENLYKLEDESIEWSETADQETVLSFRYVNLESDEVRNFNHQFGGG